LYGGCLMAKLSAFSESQPEIVDSESIASV